MLLTLVGACYFPALYVLPFYVLRGKNLPRDHPATIKRRMLISAVATCAAAWIPTWLSLEPGQAGMLELLGLRGSHLLPASCLPLALTTALFLGPLYMLSEDWRLGVGPSARVPPYPAALRNLVVAPLTEEFAFRSCLVSFLLAHQVRPAACIFLSPLAFGAAHLHNMVDAVTHQGVTLHHACAVALFQLVYTTVFGWYATYLLLRTGSLLALVLVHSFCNFMGFPAFHTISSYPHPARVWAAFVAGVAAFFWLLHPFTDPALYRGYGQDYVRLFA